MFENLTDRLEGAFKKIKGQGKITEVNVSSTLKDVRRALVDADVHYKIAKQFTNEVKEKALGQDVLNAVSPGQLLVKIMQDELTELMGGSEESLNLNGNPPVILAAGLQGSGKTTMVSKLAYYLQDKHNKQPLLVACDVYRPAAIEQLHVMGEKAGADVYSEEDNKDPVAIAKSAIQEAHQSPNDVVIIDTAGRNSIDEEMMDEIAALKQEVEPHETLFVVDAMTGQDAVNTAEAFNERLDYEGVALTKLDGDARGGAALSIKYVVDKPIKFVGTGEEVTAIEKFHPDRMAQRILGMGDIASFVERAQEQYDKEEAQKLQKKIKKDQFDFDDFLSQLQQIRNMGNIKELMGMIPGMRDVVKNADIDEEQFDKIEVMIQSMTPEERKNPQLLNGSRRKRIAEGSGTSIQEVNQFIKQFGQMRKMMKKMQKMPKGGAQALQQFLS